MTAEHVVLLLCRVILGDKSDPRRQDNGLMPLVIDGRQHVARCPRGQWLSPKSPRPDGDPCSDRCQFAWAAIGLAGAWLKANERPAPAPCVQLELEMSR